MTDRTHRCTRDHQGAHDQGTHACYTICRCRCWDCCTARSDYERNRARRNNSGRPLTVDAEPVRRHVLELAAQGIGQRTVVERAGMSRTTMQKLLGQGQFEPSRTVRAATADKILAITAADMADGAIVRAAPTWRRINELLEAGWTKKGIARHVHGPNAEALQLSRRKVTVRNARAVARLHAAWKAGQIEPDRGRRGHRTDEEHPHG